MTLLPAFILQVFLALPGCAPENLAPAPSDTVSAPPQSVSTETLVMYVSNFELGVTSNRKLPKKPTSRASASPGGPSSSNAAASKRPPSASAAPAQNGASEPAEETPADRANALQLAISDSLIRALRQAGYSAQRLPDGAPLPKTGLRIRGVFAEADEQNRARRLLVGGEAVSPNMILFVGVNNLTRPEQPLYELANPPSNDSRHGPVITVTSYAPTARFELSREPSDEELGKISADIASSLTALLRANPLLSLQ